MPLRVLVVEDDPDSLELMTYLFRSLGHEALAAISGDAALRVAATASPNLILCDLRLPDMDGFQLLSRLTADPERVMRAGFSGYVPKPIEPENFVRVAETFANAR